MDQESRTRFEAQLTDKAQKNLWAYARKRLLDARPTSSDTSEEVNQKAWDAVMEAICDVLNGVRVWNELEEPDAIRFLAKAIRSEIYAANRRGDSSRTDKLPDESEMALPARFQAQPTFQSDVEADDFFLELLDKVSGDTECEKMLWLFRDGLTKPQEVAEAMGIDVAQVYVAKKRLVRKLAAYRK